MPVALQLNPMVACRLDQRAGRVQPDLGGARKECILSDTDCDPHVRCDHVAQGGKGIDSLTNIYVAAMDALWPICPDCLFLVEGALLEVACHMLTA